MAKSVSFRTEKKLKLKDSKYRNSYLAGQIDCKNTKERSKFLSTHSEKILQYLLEMCQKCHWNATFWAKKKMKEQDGDHKVSSPVAQIDRKNRKKKIKLLPKWFANSFRKNTPICAGNVPKLPKMSLFEPREKSPKRMATSKFALQ